MGLGKTVAGGSADRGCHRFWIRRHGKQSVFVSTAVVVRMSGNKTSSYLFICCVIEPDTQNAVGYRTRIDDLDAKALTSLGSTRVDNRAA